MQNPGKIFVRFRKDTALFVLLTIIVILFIVGLSFIFVSTGERERSRISSNSFEAFYLAESGAAEAVNYLQNLFVQPLIDKNNEVNSKVLSILDIDRAEHFTETFQLKKISKHAKVKVTFSFRNIHRTPFIGYVDEYEEVPESLKTYKREGREKKGLRGLGGWSGDLFIESVGSYKNARRKVEVTRKIKVSDLTPIGENYTFFITAKGEEYLKNGEFRLSNFSISRNLKGMVETLIGKIADSVTKGMGKAAISLFWDPSTKTYVTFSGD
ncbi:hypothetical protein ACFL35_06880, partial [Candidatus Riflebacteria bacterium]